MQCRSFGSRSRLLIVRNAVHSTEVVNFEFPSGTFHPFRGCSVHERFRLQHVCIRIVFVHITHIYINIYMYRVFRVCFYYDTRADFLIFDVHIFCLRTAVDYILQSTTVILFKTNTITYISVYCIWIVPRISRVTKTTKELMQYNIHGRVSYHT